MATYSLAIKGQTADSAWTTKPLTLPDTNALPGSMQNAMQNGTQLLCKGPDGQFRYYTLDAERSTPANPILVAVGP